FRLLVTFAKVGLFGVLMLAVGTRVIPWLLAQVARTGHRELFTLAVLVVALGVAVVAAFAFEVSLALGAFLAGVAISESDQAHDLIIASAIITIALNSLLFRSIEPLAERLRDIPVVRGFDDRRAGTLAHLERDRAEKLQRHAVVAGHGRVGSLVTRALQRRNMEVLVVEQDRGLVEALRDAGTAAIYGDAGHALVLERTHLDRAILLV